MKLNFGHKLVVSFLVIFVVFTTLIIVFEQSRARRYKTDQMTERLDAYADQVLAKAPEGVFPADLRITLVGRDGVVLSDNEADPASMDNHLARPEIAAAIATGSGTDIRTSTSNRHPYLYYAQDNGGPVIVRVALPYDVKVRSFLKPDNAFLYFVVALFVVGLGSVLWLGRYFSIAQQRLQHLEVRDRSRTLKRELTGNVAHELRTPVTSIRGFLEIVLDNDLQTPRAQEYLQRAYYQVLGLSDLISDMGLLARLDDRRDGFKFTDIDLETLLGKVRRDMAEKLAQRGIVFVVEMPEHLKVRGNESLLYSVFRNLTENVVAYAGENVEIRVRATPKPDGGVEFSFTDNGVGIPDESHLGRLFERFYRVDEGRTRDNGGSGLGLAIVKNAVQLHGGTISVRNAEPHGLEFDFTLA